MVSEQMFNTVLNLRKEFEQAIANNTDLSDWTKDDFKSRCILLFMKQNDISLLINHDNLGKLAEQAIKLSRCSHGSIISESMLIDIKNGYESFVKYCEINICDLILENESDIKSVSQLFLTYVATKYISKLTIWGHTGIVPAIVREYSLPGCSINFLAPIVFSSNWRNLGRHTSVKDMAHYLIYMDTINAIMQR